jgi:hypothetical protein
MNSHLNIFNTYTNEFRRIQLENDLTRAFAICLQENTLFFNEVLKSILDPADANELFSDIYSKNEIAINIQKRSSEINDFEKIYAVSLSENEMTVDHFWNQKHDNKYDPRCDLVININGIAIIVETKRDNWDCTAQLWNQAFNICNKDNGLTEDMRSIVTPKDLNWFKLMNIAVKVHSFEKATGHPDRFLKDFINLVKGHNFRWLPEPSISSVSCDNTNAIRRRIESTLNELVKNYGYKKLDYNDRLGLWFDQHWAQELLFKVEENGGLSVTVYPGNTKAQGNYIFQRDPQPKTIIQVDECDFPVSSMYHVKFTSFQRYFTGLWFKEDALREVLYTKENFYKYCGRNKKGNDWNAIESLFNKVFKEDFDWKNNCEWNAKVIKSNRSQFDMSFGYELGITIPFEILRLKDQDKSDLSNLANFIDNIYKEFRTIYS